MIVLAILYRHLRYLPNTDRLFHGLNAAVVALIVVTARRMGKNTLRHGWQWVIGVLACLTVVVIGATVIEVVLAAGLIGVFIDSFAEKPLQVWRRISEVDGTNLVGSATRDGMHSIVLLGLAMPLMLKLGVLLTIGAVFLRIGSITFGGGFVMIPLIEAEAVDAHHRVAGTLGALVATISIFLPHDNQIVQSSCKV